MLINDARKLYLGSNPIDKAYLGSNLVWELPVPILTSRGLTGNQGLTVGTTIIKDMGTGSKTTSGSYTPNGQTLSTNRVYWSDWGNDIFDNWGYFYIYDPQNNSYISPILNPLNTADGVITTQQFSANGRTFTLKFGYVATGIYKMDVSVADNYPFVFGMDGNMGSNISTQNYDYSYAYTKDGESLNLYYNYNVQLTIPNEAFYAYFAPYEVDKNKATRPYQKFVYDTDNLAMYTVQLRKGMTVYFAKQNDVKQWIVNDLQLV